MIVSPLNTRGKPRKAYLTVKNKKHEGGNKHPEGKYQIWLYREDIILHNVKYYKYYCLRYAGEPARFKTINDAKEFACYYLGL